MNTESFYNNIKSKLPKKIFKDYLKILENFKTSDNIDKHSSNLPNLLSRNILIEYYCSKKVIKCLKIISRKN